MLTDPKHDPKLNPPVEFHDTALLDAAGRNPEAIQNLLMKWGQPFPSTAAIYQWSSRGKITNRWRAALLYALLSEGKVKLSSLFKRGKPAA